MKTLQPTIHLALIIYAITFLLAQSHIFKSPREAFGRLLDRLFGESRYEFEECRMCVGFWVSLLLWLAFYIAGWAGDYDLLAFLAAYGLSYFLATQER